MKQNWGGAITDNWVECANIGWRWCNTEYHRAPIGTIGCKGSNFYGINNIGDEIKEHSEYGIEYWFEARTDFNFSEFLEFTTTPCTPYYVSETEFKRNGLWYKPEHTYEYTVVKKTGTWAWETKYVHDHYRTSYEKNLHNFARSAVTSKEVTVSKFVGNLIVTYTHFGKQKIQKIPVYFEQRPCSKDQ